MGLWRVDVAGVSSRFVDADSREEAVSSVTSAVLTALDVRASPAASPIALMYQEGGPLQRKRIIAALDGLTPPAGVRESRNARRRLARLIRYDIARRNWVKNQLAPAPRSVDPELLVKLLTYSEGAHVRALRERLHRHDFDGDV